MDTDTENLATKGTEKTTNQSSSGMSKKAAIAGMAITSIGASDDFHAQIVIAIVAGIAIIAQTYLDASSKKTIDPDAPFAWPAQPSDLSVPFVAKPAAPAEVPE